MFFGGYGYYILFSLPALLLGLWAQSRVKSAFKKYSRVRLGTNLTGAEVARRILDASGLYDVVIEPVRGFMSDHYDPRSRTLRLSPEVYQGNSVAAAGIAAHETGHALQHGKGYLPLKFRTAMVPTVQVGSWLGPIVFFLGLLMRPIMGTTLAWVGIGLFAAMVVFALVTLPVELDASRRAKKLLVSQGIVFQQELQGASSVLDAAALTYVAAAVQAVSTLLYYTFLLTGSRRR
ncbi:MAG: zinc metallopeptidase [Anaerolineales bacterium]|nr:zinc metallopeptidase [Anaerolineales bacterium]